MINGCVSQYVDFLPETHEINKRDVLKPVPDKYDYTESVNNGNYSPKTHQFLIIFDTSVSMSESVSGRVKYDVAKDILYRMIHMIPDIYSFKTLKNDDTQETVQFLSGLTTFGSRESIFKGATTKIIPVKKFSRKEFEGMINPSDNSQMNNKLTLARFPSGESPLDLALESAIVDLKNVNRQTAIIIISDYKELNSRVRSAVRKLLQTFGENINIYNIFIGDDKMAKIHMNKIASISKNTHATLSEELVSNEGLSKFVETVFLKYNRPIDPIIPFIEKLKELCQASPGLINPEDALIMPIHFDLDAYYVKEIYYNDLNKIIEALNEYPDVCMELRGHTDNTHTWEYNMELSQKRAEAVKQYFVEHGLINTDRITIQGFAFQYPFNKDLGNSTPEAREKNRRTEITRIDCQ